MCKIDNINVEIKKLDFGRRGKMSVYLTDGREVIIPLNFFPDIKHLSMKDKEGWMILDDQFFTFQHLSKIYSVSDIMSLNLN